MNKIFFPLLLACCCLCVKGQELNAKVNLNTSKIPGSDKSVFATLQKSLEQLLNGTRWTDGNFTPVEKIECTFNIILNSVQDNAFSGEIQVTASRPVYNASYVSPSFNFRDVDLSFNYTEGETLEYTPNTVTNNLIAVMSYYAYIVIGLDYDSFSPDGGAPYFRTAMQIVNAAQSLGAKGWAAFDNDRNRYALALGLTEESMKPFHDLWYRYHRLGLDDMAGNVNRGKAQILAAIGMLPKLKEVRTGNANVLFFGDTKLDEIVQIFEKSPSDERLALYKTLNELFPSKSNIVDRLNRQ